MAALPTLEWYIRVAFTLSTGPCTPLSKLHLSHPRTAAARSDIYERYNVGSSPTLAWWSVRLPRGGRISAGSSAYASSTHVTHHRGSHTHTVQHVHPPMYNPCIRPYACFHSWVIAPSERCTYIHIYIYICAYRYSTPTALGTAVSIWSQATTHSARLPVCRPFVSTRRSTHPRRSRALPVRAYH